jgi:hypothetical protein
MRRQLNRHGAPGVNPERAETDDQGIDALVAVPPAA